MRYNVHVHSITVHFCSINYRQRLQPIRRRVPALPVSALATQKLALHVPVRLVLKGNLGSGVDALEHIRESSSIYAVFIQHPTQRHGSCGYAPPCLRPFQCADMPVGRRVAEHSVPRKVETVVDHVPLSSVSSLLEVKEIFFSGITTGITFGITILLESRPMSLFCSGITTGIT